ncbi:hypothetical protein ACTXG7_15045 [Mycolicibacterium sp. Dal123E01]
MLGFALPQFGAESLAGFTPIEKVETAVELLPDNGYRDAFVAACS